MPIRREWHDDRGWVDTIVCEYCFDDATSTGPRGNGTTDVALLRHHAGRIWGFCSPACRRSWVNVTFADGYHTDHFAVADDVDHDVAIDRYAPP